MAESAHPEGERFAHMKRRAATFSVGLNVFQVGIKVAGAVLTGSVSLLSEAVHSATDVVSSLLAFFSVRAAAAPPDDEHPYGHGKIESLGGFGESILLFLICGYVGFEAVQRLLIGGEVRNLGLGIGIMAASTVLSLGGSIYVRGVARLTNSMALRANGQHLFVDFWTSVGVLLALGVTYLTGWVQADSLAALVLVAWIARGAWRLGRDAFHQLIDRRLSDDELRRVEALIDEEPELISHHRLRTRFAGDVRYIEFHAVVPNDWSVVRAHELADRLEKRIADALAPAYVVVHVDPYDPAKDR
jgi:cation diffusion facilitator family transporter